MARSTFTGLWEPPGALWTQSSIPLRAQAGTKVRHSADTSLELEAWKQRSRVPHLIPNPCCSESKTPTWWEASQKV